MTAPECDVTACGQIRCDRCDERLTCLGPEPRACGATCADCPCSCPPCRDIEADQRADLALLIEQENQ